ncbi:hypothetical protein RHMOL_Rhmol10G0183500 [Rhododendron molle]|uniref:Uncharacterized protein n=1 Tax=Rhododendron molle TaxID=49168 RepID=A0ACC0M4W1_RHOML|nr:hypothetical protein RHMOL_Rhmol10G0183500 [Rhododendron molle]
MESYIDTIKDYAKKLAIASSPLDENDLIFRTLRGLTKTFNGFKMAIKTRGDTISFSELITMLKGEDLQLLQEFEVDTTTVLVANHTSQVQDSCSSNSIPSTIPSQLNVSQQHPPSQSSFPQQQVLFPG